MKSKCFSWTSLTSRRYISIPVVLVGGLALVGSTVLVTTRLVATPAQAQAAPLTPPVASTLSTSTTTATPASFVRNVAATPSLAGLTSFEVDEPQEQPAPVMFAGIAAVIESAGSFSAASETMLSHGGLASAGAPSPANNQTRWQTDPRWMTMIDADDHRITTDQTGAEYDIAFMPETETGMARSLLASASFTFNNYHNHNSAASFNDDFVDQSLVVNPQIARSRRGNSLLGDLPSAELGDLASIDPTTDVVPKSAPDPSPPAITPDKSNDDGVDPSTVVDQSRDPGVTGPMSGVQNNVPEPFTIPILLVGWLLLFRARRNRLDLAKLEQLLQESGSMKLPPGSSDLTRAQLQATSRRTVTPRD